MSCQSAPWHVQSRTRSLRLGSRKLHLHPAALDSESLSHGHRLKPWFCKLPGKGGMDHGLLLPQAQHLQPQEPAQFLRDGDGGRHTASSGLLTLTDILGASCCRGEATSDEELEIRAVTCSRPWAYDWKVHTSQEGTGVPFYL